ncbi:MAG: hypothetical protein GMKNLPBB_02361 [Myxococcota bacterium]|nr:hypothetical protein [Myxococcota bacterium]
MPPEHDPRRARLEERHAILLRALLRGAPPPPGFDPARIEAVRQVLKHRAETAAARGEPKQEADPRKPPPA